MANMDKWINALSEIILFLLLFYIIILYDLELCKCGKNVITIILKCKTVNIDN